MNMMSPSVPTGGSRALLDALYEGNVFLLDATETSSQLVESVWARLDAEFEDVGGPSMAAARLSPEVFFERVGRLRREFYCEPAYHKRLCQLMSERGFDLDQVAFDPGRLRVIAHRGHENPRAKAVYYPHRDTWYGHPQSLITWWMPLHDIPASETFVFLPDYFDKPVPNNSEIFDYAAWVKDGPDLKIGWQKINDGAEAQYPGVTGEFAGEEVGFSCRRAQHLIFAGSHFHRTLPHDAGYTRYSLDFRLVHLGDTSAGHCAPNVDNRSRGSAVPGYERPATRR